jgi:hypothetical protein
MVCLFDGRNAQAMKLFSYGLPAEAPRYYLSCTDRVCRVIGAAEDIRLLEVLILKTRSAPRIGLTGEQELLQPLRAAEGIESLQLLEHRVGA